MTERLKEGRRGLDILQKLDPPQWMSEMQRYFALHGTYRPEDLQRLMQATGQTTEPLDQQLSRAAELLQHFAAKR